MFLTGNWKSLESFCFRDFVNVKYENTHFTFSIVKQWYHFWVLTAKQVGTSTLSSRALAAMLGH